MFIINKAWGDKLVIFKDDPTGLGVLASIQLGLPAYSIWIMGAYWPVPGNQKYDSLRLEDKLQCWLHKLKILVPPRQHMINTISRQLVKHQTSNEATIVLGDFNSKWGVEATHRGDKALNSWAEAAGLVNGPYEVAKTLNLQLLTRVTIEGGIWIDYILHTDRQNNIKCIGVHTV